MMPSRKSQGVYESQESLGQSSMRRLSSIASLHQLLPFTRNRRAHVSSDTLSSSSPSDSAIFAASTNTLPSSTQALKPALDAEKLSSSLEPQKKSQNKKESDLPRSNTFSYLPLPKASKSKQQKPVQPSTAVEAHTVLTRLPTPTQSTRRYLPFGSRSDHARAGLSRTKLTRSDTEPLLSTVLSSRKNAVHKPITFKENLAPILAKTPTFPYARLDDGIDSVSDDSPSFESKLNVSPPMFCEQNCNQEPATPTKTLMPAASLADDKTPTQRSYLAATAPVLRHRQALGDISNSGRIEHIPSIVQSVKETIEPLCGSPRPLDLDKVNAPYARRPITDAQPVAYWSGRVSSLLDRYQSQELAASSERSGSMAPRSESDKLHSQAAMTRRVRRAFGELFMICATDEARDSFVQFQLQYAALHNDAELAKPVGPPTTRAKVYLSGSGKSSRTLDDVLIHTSGSGRKPSFVDRLLGRSKRQSLS